MTNYPNANETVRKIADAVHTYHRAMAAANPAQRCAAVADLADHAADLFEAAAKYYRGRASVWRPVAPPSATHEDVTGEEC